MAKQEVDEGVGGEHYTDAYKLYHGKRLTGQADQTSWCGVESFLSSDYIVQVLRPQCIIYLHVIGTKLSIMTTQVLLQETFFSKTTYGGKDSKRT